MTSPHAVVSRDRLTAKTRVPTLYVGARWLIMIQVKRFGDHYFEAVHVTTGGYSRRPVPALRVDGLVGGPALTRCVFIRRPAFCLRETRKKKGGADDLDRHHPVGLVGQTDRNLPGGKPAFQRGCGLRYRHQAANVAVAGVWAAQGGKPIAP